MLGVRVEISAFLLGFGFRGNGGLGFRGNAGLGFRGNGSNICSWGGGAMKRVSLHRDYGGLALLTSC